MLSFVRRTDPTRISNPPSRPIHQPKLMLIFARRCSRLVDYAAEHRERQRPIAIVAVISRRGHDSAWRLEIARGPLGAGDSAAHGRAPDRLGDRFVDVLVERVGDELHLPGERRDRTATLASCPARCGIWTP